MLKVVNTMVPKNNTFHQFYHFTTFEVAFYHPPGLTVWGLGHSFKLKLPLLSNPLMPLEMPLKSLLPSNGTRKQLY